MSDGTIEAAVRGAETGCDWVRQCHDCCEERKFVRKDGTYDIRMLPEIMQERIPQLKPIVKAEGGLEALKRKDLSEAVYILPPDYFSPKVFDSRRVMLTPDTYAIHHYQNSWFSPKAFAYYRTRTLLINLFGYKFVRRAERLLRRK